MAGWMSSATIVAALAKHKDLQLVLSLGDQLDPNQLGPVPNNAIIVKRAPQLELLKQTTVCIAHAGLNTVLGPLPAKQSGVGRRNLNELIEGLS
jgi:UDP:flavonoid glycosyltransferase YjiC (YdhE family)